MTDEARPTLDTGDHPFPPYEFPLQVRWGHQDGNETHWHVVNLARPEDLHKFMLRCPHRQLLLSAATTSYGTQVPGCPTCGFYFLYGAPSAGDERGRRSDFPDCPGGGP